MRVALVTHSGKRELSDSDERLFKSLERLQIETFPVPWDEPTSNWHDFNLIILRSTWNYHLKLTDFTAWVKQMKFEGLPLINSADLVLWNSNKTYLLELQKLGYNVLPSIIVEYGDHIVLKQLMEEHGWDNVVFKPIVSADSFLTHWATMRTAEVDQVLFEEALSHSHVLVQPLAELILTHGEWSLIFIQGVFSHAVIKHPQKGDFRVQTGTVTHTTAPKPLIEQSARLVNNLRELPFYARVDSIWDELEEQMLLMELELIEPSLYFDHAAAERMAKAIANTLSNR